VKRITLKFKDGSGWAITFENLDSQDDVLNVRLMQRAETCGPDEPGLIVNCLRGLYPDAEEIVVSYA